MILREDIINQFAASGCEQDMVGPTITRHRLAMNETAFLKSIDQPGDIRSMGDQVAA